MMSRLQQIKAIFCLRIHSPGMNITVNLSLTLPLRACSISKNICVGWCLIRGYIASFRALGLYCPPIVSPLWNFKGKHPSYRGLQCDLVPASACPASAAEQHSALWQAQSHPWVWFSKAGAITDLSIGAAGLVKPEWICRNRNPGIFYFTLIKEREISFKKQHPV